MNLMQLSIKEGERTAHCFKNKIIKIQRYQNTKIHGYI